MTEHSMTERSPLCIVSLHLDAAEPWAVADRDWFAANPDRSHRLRGSYPGEWPGGRHAHTVVKQPQPGFRLLHPITLMPELLALGEPPEEAVWAIFDLVSEATEKGNRSVTVEAIIARYRQLAAEAGRA